MKKLTVGLIIAIVLLSLLALPVMAKGGNNNDKCTTIQDGTLVDSNDDLLVLGYDQYGYNYQAHMFNGRYCDSDRVLGGDYCDVNLVMKWNDAWLSNKDCDGDGKLDRHYGYPSYIGSGAWVTNHQSGSYLGDDGKMHKWTYFCKIVAAPTGAEKVDGVWYTADGTEIGPDIWGAFVIIQEVESGTGATYVSPARAGLGNW